MKNIKKYIEFINEEEIPASQRDYRSKDQMYIHKNDVFFMWDYDKKDLEILPNIENPEIEALKDFKPLHISGVDKEAANNIIGILLDHPYEDWAKILNDKKIPYEHITNEEPNGESNREPAEE